MANRVIKHGKEARQRIYDYLVEYIKENGYAPSVREICEGVGLKSTSSVYTYLSRLKREGKIKMRGNSPRAICIVGYEFVKQNEADENEMNENDGE